MDVRSFADLAPERRVHALNRVFEGYVLPFKMSAEQFALHVETNDIVLEASPVLMEGGEIAAAALAGIRNERAWIGGFGVVPEQRGRGLGRRLLDETLDAARARGASEMQLEVLQNNPGAIALYESAGFERSRALNSFRANVGARPAAAVREVPVRELLESATQAQPPCWQREPASLLKQPQIYGFLSDGAGAALRRNGPDGQLAFASANAPETLYALVDGVAAYAGIERLVLFNEPGESPICEWAAQAGWAMPFAQYEMRRAL